MILFHGSYLVVNMLEVMLPVLMFLPFTLGREVIHKFTMEIKNPEKQTQTFDLKQNEIKIFYINRLDSMILSCSASGQSIYVAILKNGKELTREIQSDSHGIVHATYRVGFLDCTDSGTYVCQAGNAAGWTPLLKHIIVKCPMKPVKFDVGNVHKLAGSHDLVLQCDRHAGAHPSEPYNISIKYNMGQALRSSVLGSYINFSFPNLTCEDMGTYTCETWTPRKIFSESFDLIVLHCPPIISSRHHVVEADLGNHHSFSVNVTLPERVVQLTALYSSHQEMTNTCGSKLCIAVLNTYARWIKQVNITLLNVTAEDLGHQTISLCTTGFRCGNITMFLRLKADELNGTVANDKSNSTRKLSKSDKESKRKNKTKRQYKNKTMNATEKKRRSKEKKIKNKNQTNNNFTDSSAKNNSFNNARNDIRANKKANSKIKKIKNGNYTNKTVKESAKQRSEKKADTEALISAQTTIKETKMSDKSKARRKNNKKGNKKTPNKTNHKPQLKYIG